MPVGKEYMVPWLLGMALAPILSSVGSPAFVEFRAFQLSKGCLALGALCVLSFLFDGTLLWSAIRSQFVTWETGRGSFLAIYALLIVFYTAAWAITLSIRGTIAPELHFSKIEACTTLGVLAVALVGLVPALGISAIWKLEDPGFANVRLARRTLLVYMDKLLTQTISPPEYSRVVSLATTVEKEASASLVRAPRPEDRAVLELWADAASSTVKSVSGFALTDLTSLDRLPELRAARDKLDRRS